MARDRLSSSGSRGIYRFGERRPLMTDSPISFLQHGLKPGWQSVPSAVMTMVEYDFENATHKGAVYRHDGSVVIESLRPARLGHWRHVDPLTISVGDYADAPITDAAIFGGHFFNMWGHFLFETMTTAAVAAELPHWPVVFAPFAPDAPERFLAVWENFKTLLAAGGWNDRDLILQTSPMRFNTLIVPERLSVFGLPNGSRAIAPEVKNVFRRITAKFGEPAGDKRPMVARRPDWTPRMHPAEHDVYELLAGQGYLVVDVASLTAIEQARVFSNSTVLVGFAGSNMHNSVLCPPGTPILEIGDLRSYQSANRINPVQTSLASLMAQPAVFVESFEEVAGDMVAMSADAIVKRVLAEVTRLQVLRELPVNEAGRAAWAGSLTYSDPITFPPIDSALLASVGAGFGVVRETPFASRQFLRYAPEFIDDPDGCGLFEGLGASVYTSSPCFVAAADDAALVGYRTIIAGGHFFNDEVYRSEKLEPYLTGLSKPDPFWNEDTRLRRQAESDIFHLEQSGQPWRRYEGAAVILASQEPSNYGSFLFRVLPKVHALKRHGLTNLPVVCWDIKPATSALLEIAGIDPAAIIFQDTQTVSVFDRVIIPSLRNPYALLDYESRDVYRQIRHEYGSPEGGKRLYISRFSHSRRGVSGRVMLNEEELIARLSAIGFEIVEPEKLSVRQQIALFSSAEIVVGPSGAGMFNIVFCRPGTKVIDIESEPHWIYAHAGLFASCELRYGIFVGRVDETDERAVHRRWNVNINVLMDRVQSFLRA